MFYKIDINKEYEIYNVDAQIYENHNCFPKTMCLHLYWNGNLGSGELIFNYNRRTKEWESDTECMNKEFCKAVFSKWLDSIMF